MASRSSSRATRRSLGSTSRAARRSRARAEPTAGGLLLKPSARHAIQAIEAIPDLLDRVPRLTVDAPDLCAALDFAYAGGGCLDTLEQALDTAALGPSEWSSDAYASDLFLEDFVATCFSVHIQGWEAPLNRPFLVRVLAHPPSDSETVTFRRAILTRLTNDRALRDRFEKLYRALCRLRACFDHAGNESRYETTRRRIDTLTVIRDVFELAASGFEGGDDDGLGRIDAFAAEVTASDGFQRLAELLDYENDLAKVDVRMQVGADGRVRKFELVSFTENVNNRFYATPLGRIVSKVVLWWRGYRFSSDELVDRWLDHVFQGVTHFLPPCIQLLGHMELYLAALHFRDHCAAKGLEVCFPDMVDSGGREFRGLFNPLLFKQGVVPTPCDITTDGFDTITIVTGPNSGGKTRLLQALGLAQLLGQAGLYAPAAQARLRPASGMFVSVIDRPKAEQEEGRLGTELIRIRRLFETSHGGALVILDELCSGTNPSEGEEIFYLVLSLLEELGAEAFITTHFLEFARRLADENEPLRLRFLQVDLDEHQRPTYGFVPGVASTSLAAQTAARLGVTREELMSLVRRNKR